MTDFFKKCLYKHTPLFLSVILIIVSMIVFAAGLKFGYGAVSSVAVMFFSVGCILLLCNISAMSNFVWHNIFLVIIFVCGVLSYCSYYNGVYDDTQNSSFYRKAFSAIHNSSSVAAAFFPSRGEYEIANNGTDEDKEIEGTTLVGYGLFHVFVYIFFGYFLIGVWGFRFINRVRFAFSSCSRQHFFWCESIEPKMLAMAKSFNENDLCSQITFSISEMKYIDSDLKTVFRDMNHEGFCLKLRKDGQVHDRKKCLNAAEHFFISDNFYWNIDQAEAFLRKRAEKKCRRQVKIYIRINNDVGKRYFTNWADSYCKEKNVEIILFDETAMLARKFVKEFHMLQTLPPNAVNHETARIKDGNSFKVLMIGFGGIGKTLLEYIVCDSQFLLENGKKIPFSADIIDSNAAMCDLYRTQCKDVCSDFGFSFKNWQVPSKEFYDFINDYKKLKEYNRIVVALGDVGLNIDTVELLENVIRKNIDLNAADPYEEFDSWKNKIVLVSPELDCSVFAKRTDKEVFSVFGGNYEVYKDFDQLDREVIANAKAINHRYSLFADSKITANEAWLQCDMYNKDSSIASAFGFYNLKLLLGDTVPEGEKYNQWKKACGEMEHLRWMAYVRLCEGMSSWKKTSSRTVSANQRDFMRHAAIADFDELPELDKQFPEKAPFQEKDIVIIDIFKDWCQKQAAENQSAFADK